VAKRKQKDSKRRAPAHSAAASRNDVQPPVTPAAQPASLLESPTALLAVTVLLAAFLWVFYASRPDLGVIAANIIYFVAQWFGDSESQLGILDRAPLVAFAAAEYLLAYAAGRLMLESAGCSTRFGRVELAVFSTAAGLSMFSLFTLITGVTVGLHGWLFVAAALLLIAAAAVRGWKWWQQDVTRPWFIEFHGSYCVHWPESWLTRYGSWLTAPFAAAIILGGMLPPFDFDVREYHLQAPKEWSQQGWIGFGKHNVYANMPLGAEMHPLAAMQVMPGQPSWWWGALAGKLVIAGMTPLTAMALYCGGRRWLHPLAGVIAAVTYISAPWVVHVSVSGLNEGALALYWLLAVYAVLIGWERSEDGRYGLVFIAGFMAGSAVAVKYTAALLVAPVLLGMVVLLPRIIAKPFKWRPVFNAKAGLLLLAGLMAGGAAWGGKNLVLTGNPVYPLAQPLFGGETRTPDKHAQWAKAHATPPYSVTELADSASGFIWKSNLQSPLIVALGLLAVLAVVQPAIQGASAQRVAITVGCVFCTAMLLWWAATHRLERFWVPMLPLAALLAGWGAMWRQDRSWRVVLYVLLTVSLTGNALAVFQGSVGDIRYFVSLAELREDGPPDSRGIRVNPVHRVINNTLTSDQAVLLVGDAQPFDLVPKAYYNTCFDDCLLEVWLKDKTPAQQRAELKRRNIVLVYVSWREIARYQSKGNYGYTSYVTPQLFKQLVNDQVLEPVEFSAGSTPVLYRTVTATGKPPATTQAPAVQPAAGK